MTSWKKSKRLYSRSPIVRQRALLAGAAAFALALGGCGGDDDGDGGGGEAKPRKTTAAPAPKPAAVPKVANAEDTKSKPKIAKPSGEPPTELVSRDLVKGKGRAAKAGDTVRVQYVGVAHSTGAEFDASWGREPFEFPLGGGQVIPGWDEGVVGMKPGGRRLLVIPPDKAYGAQSPSPDIGANETLVFVIDLLKAG
jgi:peptidylprolyl isomerase